MEFKDRKNQTIKIRLAKKPRRPDAGKEGVGPAWQGVNAWPVGLAGGLVLTETASSLASLSSGWEGGKKRREEAKEMKERVP